MFLALAAQLVCTYVYLRLGIKSCPLSSFCLGSGCIKKRLSSCLSLLWHQNHSLISCAWFWHQPSFVNVFVSAMARKQLVELCFLVRSSENMSSMICLLWFLRLGTISRWTVVSVLDAIIACRNVYLHLGIRKPVLAASETAC